MLFQLFRFQQLETLPLLGAFANIALRVDKKIKRHIALLAAGKFDFIRVLLGGSLDGYKHPIDNLTAFENLGSCGVTFSLMRSCPISFL